jgi:lipopolysaccharide transport system permease protein
MAFKTGVLVHFLRQDLQHKYAGTWLGSIWSIVYPLVYIAIFILVFAKIMGAKLALLGLDSDEYGYSIYLISGMLPWTYFSVAVLRISTIFLDKAGLIGKVQLPLAQLPLSVIGAELIVFLISLVFFAFFMLWIGFPITWAWLGLIPVILIQSIFIYAIGLILAVLVIFVRDVKEVTNVVVQIWFWLTPIVYVQSIIPENFLWWFNINPVVPLLSMYRTIIIDAHIPAYWTLFAHLAIALTMTYLALRFIKGLERDLRDLI